MGGFMEYGCCFNATSFFVYAALIPILTIFVLIISWKVYLYSLMITMMEIKLLDRKVKKIASKIGKSSNSDADKPIIPIAFDPLLNTDSTNKKEMADRIPINLVQSGRVQQPSSGNAPPGPAANPAAAAAAAAVSSGPHSEEPLSPRTPARDPNTNEDVTEVSGYATRTETASDYVNVSPQDNRPKLPDMSELPSISTVDQTTDVETTTASVSQMTTPPTSTTTTSTGTTNASRKDDVDTMKMLDDPVYGLKTEILTPDVVTQQPSATTNDPFETYTVPRQMIAGDQQNRSNLMPAASDSAITNPVTNPHLKKATAPPSSRFDDLPEYTPPEHSPVAARTEKTSARHTPSPEAATAPIQRSRGSYQRFPDPSPTATDPIFTPPHSTTERRERSQGIFDVGAASSQHSPRMDGQERERSDRQYAKPSGYFAQRAKAWLANNRDSDSVEEK